MKSVLVGFDDITINFHGFTKDPVTLKYMIVMDYANKVILGLCRPVGSFLKENEIYGVMSFMAPEVLKGKSYTSASDIYSFSMIMWEFTSGVPPFNNRAHDFQLSLNLMKKCWNEDPLKRPSASEVKDVIMNWDFRPDDDEILVKSRMKFLENEGSQASVKQMKCYKVEYGLLLNGYNVQPSSQANFHKEDDKDNYGCTLQPSNMCINFPIAELLIKANY
ncbi:unnamed protein product [Rhizophagus irregularis]|nr:unnamed protein product [Rhizophagus irregularis]